MSDTSDDTERQPQAGRWMTYAEAATHYGKSTKTIERWADTGKLRRDPTSRPVRVWVPEGDPSDTSDDIVGPEERSVALAERLSDIVERRVRPVIEALERSEERGRQLERENGAYQERIAALERVVETVRQMSEADRHDLASAQATNAEQARALDDARKEIERLRCRAWWRFWER